VKHVDYFFINLHTHVFIIKHTPNDYFKLVHFAFI